MCDNSEIIVNQMTQQDSESLTCKTTPTEKILVTPQFTKSEKRTFDQMNHAEADDNNNNNNNNNSNNNSHDNDHQQLGLADVNSQFSTSAQHQHQQQHQQPKRSRHNNRQHRLMTRAEQHQSGDLGGQLFSCELCSSSSFASAAMLRQHVELHHMAAHASMWICSDCQKLFTSKSNLKVHLRVHTKIKPYHCKSCAYSCMHHSSIKEHLAKLHPDVAHTSSNPAYVFNSIAVPDPEQFNSAHFDRAAFIAEAKQANEKLVAQISTVYGTTAAATSAPPSVATTSQRADAAAAAAKRSRSQNVGGSINISPMSNYSLSPDASTSLVNEWSFQQHQHQQQQQHQLSTSDSSSDINGGEDAVDSMLMHNQTASSSTSSSSSSFIGDQSHLHQHFTPPSTFRDDSATWLRAKLTTRHETLSGNGSGFKSTNKAARASYATSSPYTTTTAASRTNSWMLMGGDAVRGASSVSSTNKPVGVASKYSSFSIRSLISGTDDDNSAVTSADDDQPPTTSWQPATGAISSAGGSARLYEQLFAASLLHNATSHNGSGGGGINNRATQPQAAAVSTPSAMPMASMSMSMSMSMPCAAAFNMWSPYAASAAVAAGQIQALYSYLNQQMQFQQHSQAAMSAMSMTRSDQVVSLPSSFAPAASSFDSLVKPSTTPAFDC